MSNMTVASAKLVFAGELAKMGSGVDLSDADLQDILDAADVEWAALAGVDYNAVKNSHKASLREMVRFAIKETIKDMTSQAGESYNVQAGTFIPGAGNYPKRLMTLMNAAKWE